MDGDRRDLSNAPKSLTETAGLGTGPVSMEPYRSAEFFEKERDRVFRRAWLLLGREEETPNPGDYVVKEIEVCEASVLITRSKTGKVQAFHNVCSHRGNQVVLSQSGNANRFICSYHNWTYAPDGRLLAVPDEENFFNLDKAKCGLTQIATEVWEGWVFVNLARTPEVTLREFLGEMGNFLAGMPYPSAATPIVFVSELNCNWKVISDAFAESYHIPAIHKNTLGSTFASKSNPFGHVLGARVFGPHRHTSMYGNSEYEAPESSKVERLGQAGVTTASTISAVPADLLADLFAHPAVNPAKTPDWSMDVNQIFPNSQLDVGQGGFFLHQFWPITHNRTRHEVRFYIPEPTNVLERFKLEQLVARICDVFLEDLSNVERVQKGLQSRAKDFMQLQDNELLLRHCIEQSEKWVAAETAAEALA